MKIKTIIIALAFILCSQIVSASCHPPFWGFYGHRLINRMAIFTLPPEMIGFYKDNIEYLTEHAVDPDKRRYATKFEAARHYLDMDQYGEYPFERLPRTWYPFLARYAELYVVLDGRDTVKIMGDGYWRASNREYKLINDTLLRLLDKEEYTIPLKNMHSFVAFTVNGAYRKDDWQLPVDSLKLLFDNNPLMKRITSCYGSDSFTAHGILPYNLDEMLEKLTRAFVSKDRSRILRLSAELGHYIADAHVPLHTSKNYNGQLTDQDGIHAFWESRIPELFAESDFDFLVGKAQYVKETNDYFWKVIFDSNEGVELLLKLEKDLKKSFPQDRQFCYEDRLNQVIRTQCQDFAKAYNNKLDGQVEDRMRESIISVGNMWYTAWINAGQPDLKSLYSGELSPEEKADQEELEKEYKSGKEYGRKHE